MKKPLIILFLALCFGISLYKIYSIRAEYVSKADELQRMALVGLGEYVQTHEEVSFDEVKKFIVVAGGKELAIHPIDGLTFIAISNSVLLFFSVIYLVLSGRTFNKSKQQGPTAGTR